MDKKQIIHIASEVVIISGLAIYFKLKNDSLLLRIQDLEERVNDYEKVSSENTDKYMLLFEHHNQFKLKMEKKLNNFEQILTNLTSPKTKYVEESDDNEEYIPRQKVVREKVNTRLSRNKEDENEEFKLRGKQVRENKLNESKQNQVRLNETNRENQLRGRLNELNNQVRENRLNETNQIRENRLHIRLKTEEPVCSPKRTENLDEEILNELNELSENEVLDSKTENDDIIEEIDTSLKKKV